MALYDIPRGQELTYDYGVRAMEWMKRKTGKDGTGADGGERGTGGDQGGGNGEGGGRHQREDGGGVQGGGNGEGGGRHQREDGGGVSDQREDEGGDGGVAGGSKEKGSAPGPVRRETGQRKTTTGFKRNYFWCPVKDCASGPVQKMAQHLVKVHKMDTPTSVKMAKRKVRAPSEVLLPNPAKRSSGMRALPLALAPQPSTSKCASKTPSQSAPSKTSTLGTYHSGGAFLEDFLQHLQTHAGGSRNYAPALQLTRAVGKYLHALNPEAVDSSRLLEVDSIQGYLTNLTAAGIGASGVLSRILAHKAAIHFMCLTVSYLAYHSLPPTKDGGRCPSQKSQQGHRAPVGPLQTTPRGGRKVYVAQILSPGDHALQSTVCGEYGSASDESRAITHCNPLCVESTDLRPMRVGRSRTAIHWAWRVRICVR